MITDASETRFQEKQHPGVLCAIHPDQPFDFAEKAYWMSPNPALKHLTKENGEFDILFAKWFH
jgi:cyclohexadienyl dehydratase